MCVPIKWVIITKHRTEARLLEEQTGHTVSVGTTAHEKPTIVLLRSGSPMATSLLRQQKRAAEIPQSEACWEKLTCKGR